MKRFRLFIVMAALFFLFLSLHNPFSTGQDMPVSSEPTSASAEPDDQLKISVNVKEVRLDVVVLDKKGDPITNLTADDFDVFQDNKRQKVLAGVYIDNQSNVDAQPGVSQKGSPNIPLRPAPELTREDVRRTIIFIFCDTAKFEEGYYAKMALRNFVEKQMRSGDLVAIFNTDYGNNALQMFHSDKRQLLARIDAIPMPKGLGVTGAIPVTENNQVNVLEYSISALKHMPGRKFLINLGTPAEMPPDFPGKYDMLADKALRAGVVVNTLDVSGLNLNNTNVDASISPVPQIAINVPTLVGGTVFSSWGAPLASPGMPMLELQNKLQALKKELGQLLALNWVSYKTGGIIIKDSNFFLEGIGKETESLMRGYYLVSYAPPASTFEPGGKEIYHRIKINVKRKDAVVHTRDGFFNRTDDETDKDEPGNPLMEAIFSPFRYPDLNVNMAAGYVKNSREGYLVRSWIHIAPEDVKIIETENGGAMIDLEAICLTTDTNGRVQYSRQVKYTFNIAPEKKAETVSWMQKHGVRFSLLLPVEKPGSYYVRISVKDTESGNIGSAYQYLEIPDLGKKGIALSNIFVITNPGDLEWIRADATSELSEGLFFPVFQAEEIRSPALRTYAPGDKLLTLAMIYNADEKAISRSEIETQYVLYKDGQEYLRGDARPVSPNNWGNPGEIPLLHTLTLGSDIPPGDYLLYLVSTDTKNSKKKEGVAAQALGFRVAENQACDKGGNICSE